MSDITVLNLGGGVQSTTLYLMSLDGELPPIDFALFSDLGDEPTAVYSHMIWLQSLGGPKIITIDPGNLGDALIDGGESLTWTQIPVMAKGESGQKPGRLNRQCTKDYKIRPLERELRRRLGAKVVETMNGERVCSPPAGKTAEVWYGFSTDEQSRAYSLQKRAPKWMTPRFPLLDDDLLMSRGDCERYLAERVPHHVESSACVFCPLLRDSQFERLRKTDPAGFERACDVDDALRVRYRPKYDVFVHRSCVPLRDAKLTSDQRELISPCDGGCWT